MSIIINDQGTVLMTKRIQKNIVGSYNPECHGCNGGGCGAFGCSTFTSWNNCSLYKGTSDWKYKTESCAPTCPDKPHCSRLDTESGKLGTDKSNNPEPLLEIKWDPEKGAPYTVCYYLLDFISTSNQIRNFRNIYGDSSPEYKELMMFISSLNFYNIMSYSQNGNTNNLEWCINPSSKGNCSVIKSKSDLGDLCREWYNKLNNVDKKTLIDKICTNLDKTKIDKTECDCYFRGEDVVYKQFKPNNEYNDGCWYSKCASGDPRILIPPELFNPQCPNNICQQLSTFINDNSIKINDVKQSINCVFKEKPHEDPVKPPVVIPHPNPPPVIPPPINHPDKPLIKPKEEFIPKNVFSRENIKQLILVLTLFLLIIPLYFLGGKYKNILCIFVVFIGIIGMLII